MTKKAASAKRQSRASAWLERAFSWGRGTGLMVAVAADAFGGSYGHIYELASKWGQSGWHGYTSAGLVDTLCVIGTEFYRRDRRPRCERGGLEKIISYPAFLFLAGLAVSTFANWETASGAIVNHVAATWPSFVLFLIIGLAEWSKARDAEARDREPGTGRAGNHGNREPGTTGTSTMKAAGTAPRNLRGTGPGVSRDDGSGEREDIARPAQREAVIPDGFKIPPGPHGAERELAYVRRALRALIDANPGLGRRPNQGEIARACGRRKGDLGALCRQLTDADYAGSAGRTAAGAARSR